VGGETEKGGWLEKMRQERVEKEEGGEGGEWRSVAGLGRS